MQPDGLINAEFLPQESFVARLHLEQRRTERSRRPFVLMLLELTSLLKFGGKEGAGSKIVSALSKGTRETDIKGWYKHRSVVGIIFTELGAFDRESLSN